MLSWMPVCYILSARPARGTKRDLVSKNKTKCQPTNLLTSHKKPSHNLSVAQRYHGDHTQGTGCESLALKGEKKGKKKESGKQMNMAMFPENIYKNGWRA